MPCSDISSDAYDPELASDPYLEACASRLSPPALPAGFDRSPFTLFFGLTPFDVSISTSRPTRAPKGSHTPELS